MDSIVLPNYLPHLGSGWSLFPPDSERGGFNLASGTRKITADILHVLLLRQGEDPMNPTMGIAPELFEPMSNYSPQYFVYQAQQTILEWVAGIYQLYVGFSRYQDYENQLQVEVQFIPKDIPDLNLLTFGYYQYQGAIWNQGIEPFLDSIVLNGDRLIRF
jgi:hypothetical protein